MRHDVLLHDGVKIDRSVDTVPSGTVFSDPVSSDFSSSDSIPSDTTPSNITSSETVSAGASTAHIDVEAEYRLLASLIHHPSYLFAVNESLFTGYRVAVFRAMRIAHQRYGAIVLESLESILGSVPPQLIVAHIVPPQPLIDYLATLLLRREVVRMAHQLATIAAKPSLTLSDVMSVIELKEPYTRRDGSLYDGIEQFIASMTARKSNTYRYLDTGIPFLNVMLDGEWPRSALSVVMGQAGGGKTALICQSALNMARLRIPVLVFSLEMPKEKLILRFLSHLTGIPAHLLRNGSFSDPKVVDDALALLQSLPLYVIADVGMTVDDIVHYVDVYTETKGIQAFFVDYLQIIVPPPSETMFESLGIVTQRLRDAALRHGIASIVLSQQNRQFHGLDSLLGSSRIAHIADVVVEIKIDTTSIVDLRPTRLIFHKNREGKVGESACLYNAPLLKFE